MNQTLLLGLGGTGSRAVSNVAEMLREKSIPINRGEVTCAVLDTNTHDIGILSSSGVGIPVIQTSKLNMTMNDYIDLYASRDILSWCPYTRSFGEDTMTNGASEMRFKSRIGFMDTVLGSGGAGLRELENAIDGIFHVGGRNQIRVMLVSSLSGGSGSGMFIEAALWLRHHFKERGAEVSIRGILLLPDVFVSRAPDISSNDRKRMYHYANAYAAIRELNAINKVIQKGYQPEAPIVIDGFFDSRDPGVKPVFDFAFFVDDTDASGAKLATIEDYEKMVAQLVYMQLYAPMQDELYSLEDNQYRTFEALDEPVFGSCGTARAVYPAASVLEYCALRATRQSLSEGWNGLDDEIGDLLAEQAQAERDGLAGVVKIDPRAKYVELFEQKSRKPVEKAGPGDRLYISIRRDVNNEKNVQGEDGKENTIESKNKAVAFMETVKSLIERSITKNGGHGSILDVMADIPDPDKLDTIPDNLVNKLKSLRGDETEKVKLVLDQFDGKVDGYADEIVRTLFPVNMGSVNKNDTDTLYGLLVWKDPMGNGQHFIHPIAARYLLYKLLTEIKKEQKLIAPESARSNAELGDETVSFDNKNTRRKVETLEGYWGREQTGLYKSKDEIVFFIKRYTDYNTANSKLCMEYERQALAYKVYAEIAVRLEEITKEIEDFFKSFPAMIKGLDADIEKNLKASDSFDASKLLYVNASPENKSDKYESLGLNVTESNYSMNEEVLNAVYGKFCCGRNPSGKENKPYAEKKASDTFKAELIDYFRDKIQKDDNSRDDDKKLIDLDICRAICEESDGVRRREEEHARRENLGGAFAREETEAERDARHSGAIKSYTSELHRLSAPFLIARSETFGAAKNGDPTALVGSDGQAVSIRNQTEFVLWGYHPAISDNAAFKQSTGANAKTSANSAYGKNELYCYRSVYAIKAESIKKFNELEKGDYYVNYDLAIRQMLKTGIETLTPHLDKHWHEFLPYVSKAKRTAEDKKFYEGFWQAIAYGRLLLDQNNCFAIRKRVHNDLYDSDTYVTDPVMSDNMKIGVTEIGRLIRALRVSTDFLGTVLPDVNKMYNDEISMPKNYVGTDLVKGLAVKGELNPVTMIMRYVLSRDSSSEVSSNLIGSLESLLRGLTKNYNANRSEEKSNDRALELCYEIYRLSERSRGVDTTFAAWIERFEKMGLMKKGENV